jgi:hypothetical protein
MARYSKIKAPERVDSKRGSRKILLPLLLLLNTAAAAVIYFVLLHYVRPEPVLAVYMTLFAAALFGYVCYNRGFFGRNLTPDRLPDTMTAEQKQAFIKDVNERSRRSKWLIVFGFPFGFALLFDSLTWLAEDVLAWFTSILG